MYRLLLMLISTVFLAFFQSQVIGEEKEIIDPAELLPKGSEIGDFEMNVRNLHNFSPKGIYNYMDGAADLFLEFGFDRGVATEYTGDGKRIVVEIFKMNDGDSAFGIYSLSNYSSDIQKQAQEKTKINEPEKKNPKDLKGDNFNLVGDLAVEFYKGQFYGRIAIDKEDRFTLMAFANNILSRIPKHLKRPDALNNLPRIDLISGSERYMIGILGMNQVLDLGRGDVWGFANGAKAAAGEYRLTQGVYYEQAVVIYRQPQIAESRMKMFKDMFNNLEGYKPTVISLHVTENFVAVKTPDNDYLGIRLVGSRLEVYFRVPSPNHFRMILEKNPNVSVRYPSK